MAPAKLLKPHIPGGCNPNTYLADRQPEDRPKHSRAHFLLEMAGAHLCGCGLRGQGIQRAHLLHGWLAGCAALAAAQGPKGQEAAILGSQQPRYDALVTHGQ